MEHAEIIVSFVIGLLIASLLLFVFSQKLKGVAGFFINVLAGCIALLLLSFFKVGSFSLNPLSAFLVGVAGLPGLVVIYIISAFL